MKDNTLFFSALAALLIGLSIVLGAFGAHALKDQLSEYYLGVYEKAVFYLLINALGLFLLAILAKLYPALTLFIPQILIFAGLIIFSGSLLILVFTQIKMFGAITPIGGTLMIVGWFWAAVKIFTHANH